MHKAYTKFLPPTLTLLDDELNVCWADMVRGLNPPLDWTIDVMLAFVGTAAATVLAIVAALGAATAAAMVAAEGAATAVAISALVGPTPGIRSIAISYLSSLM
jgi:hypothetical protein